MLSYDYVSVISGMAQFRIVAQTLTSNPNPNPTLTLALNTTLTLNPTLTLKTTPVSQGCV